MDSRSLWEEESSLPLESFLSSLSSLFLFLLLLLRLWSLSLLLLLLRTLQLLRGRRRLDLGLVLRAVFACVAVGVDPEGGLVVVLGGMVPLALLGLGAPACAPL